jgi:antidote-toxin recognition MazE-like antitoxin
LRQACQGAGSALPSDMAQANRSRKAAATSSKAGSSKSGSNKFSTYRANKRRQGLKLVRLWLPDPKSAAFRRRIRRQCRALRGLPEDRDALDFIETVNERENWR